MKIIFYSDKCKFCKKLFDYLEKNNIIESFKLVNIDNNNVPENIKIVPTIFDDQLNQIMEGKESFLYLLNLKYFNNPTNNIDLARFIPPNPTIKEDEMANKYKSDNLLINNETNNFVKQTQEKNKEININYNNDFKEIDEFYTKENQIIIDKKLALLMKMKQRR